MTIGRILEGRAAGIVTCDARKLVSEAIELLAQHRIGALPVVEADAVIGIFSERDVIYKLREIGPRALSLTVSDAMTSPPVTVGADTDALEALALMTRRRIRHLPVMQGGRMTGFISIGDIVKYRIDQIEAEAQAMRSYIQTA